MTKIQLCHAFTHALVLLLVATLNINKGHLSNVAAVPWGIGYTVKPVLKDHPTGHKNVVCQDR